jgi:glycine C-acetyltransferase
MTTFSKFAASAGAAISSDVKELKPLLNVSPTSIGTISLAPPLTAAALASVQQVQAKPELVQKLQANAKYLREKFLSHGFEAIGETNVVPVLMPPDIDPKEFGRIMLEEHSIWISPIWFIAKPRMRITANALHTQEDMDRLVDAMVATRKVMTRETVSA